MIREAFDELKKAESLRKNGDTEQAYKILAKLVKEHPNYYAALHTIGLVCSERNELTAALGFLTRATAVYPENHMSHTASAAVHVELGNYEAARECISKALSLKPSAVENFVTLAQIERSEKDYETAYEVLTNCLKVYPNAEDAKVLLAAVCIDLGEEDEALDRLCELLESSHLRSEVILMLTTLKGAYKRLDVKRLIGRLPKNIRLSDALFAKANALQAEGSYQSAWKTFAQANNERMLGIQSRVEINSKWEKESLAFLKSAKVQSDPLKDPQYPATIFILGPSRSGKTTIERTLRAIPEVRLGYENPIAMKALEKTFQANGLIPMHQYNILPDNLFEFCRAAYFREYRRRYPDDRILTTTSPARIHDAYQISKIIPNSFFIFVNRNPIDVAIRIFEKNYSTGNYYSFDWKSCMDHVSWYYEMTRKLTELLPHQTATIDYEDVGLNPSIAVEVVRGWFSNLSERGSIPKKAVQIDDKPSLQYSEFVNNKKVESSE